MKDSISNMQKYQERIDEKFFGKSAKLFLGKNTRELSPHLEKLGP
jgi:hypothetical protein